MAFKEAIEKISQLAENINVKEKSINSKMRKIAALEKECEALQNESCTLGGRRATLSLEKLLQIYAKSEKVQIEKVEVEVNIPSILIPTKVERSKEQNLDCLKEWKNDRLTICIQAKKKSIKLVRAMQFDAIQADGKSLAEHIIISRKKYNDFQDEVSFAIDDYKALNIAFRIDSCFYLQEGKVRFHKDYRGALLKYVLEQEAENDCDKEARVNSEEKIAE